MNHRVPPPDIVTALRRMGLLAADAAAPAGMPLTGGVSSDIWRVDLPRGPVCVKRALARLKVAAEWHAPVERNHYEALWMRHAGAALPGATPRLLGEDAPSGTLAMEYLPPDIYHNWKQQLRHGACDAAFAAAVGRTLARIHGATAADPSLAAAFPTADIFHAIRIEPYLLATAARHPDRAAALHALAASTAAMRIALVHGDVSPKNILCGPHGPVFLDAECATWGDPAFDLAFCLTHLLLKCLWMPAARAGFLACYAALGDAYRERIDWEPAALLEGRAARLLPGLLLARVDGKSPVEYIEQESDRERVRRVARGLLADAPVRLDAVAEAWRKELGE